MSVPKEDVEIGKIVDLFKMPDDNETLFDCVYHLYVLICISKGVDDIRNGRGQPYEEFRKEREEMYAYYRRQYGKTVNG